MRALVIIVGLIMALAAGCSSPSRDEESVKATVVRVPTPSPEQEYVYLATLEKIDPGLVVKPSRAVSRGRNICQMIMNPGRDLEGYVVLELSGGNAVIDRAQAREVIKAVQVWCPS